jgi:hypothetical protein
MWIGDSAAKRPEKLPLFLQRLREMGINTGMVDNGGDPQPFLDAKMPYYVENIVNRGLCLKWSSKVSDWDKMVTAWKTPRDEAGLVRDYGLDDPQWRTWARKEMQSVVKRHAAHTPLAYDIRDELSTTISANPFDYDFSPTALAGFRKWLQTQYSDLTALNTEWETKFATWDDVKPFTTDQIKNRMSGGEPDDRGFPRGKPDWQAVQQIKFDPAEARKNPARWNFAPWCDHRTYMDVSLASALGDIRDAARELDPHTPVGIEGTQMPSAFGGYDLWRLSRVLDWIEPYDIGNARAIFGSFMPGKPMLTTVGEQDAKSARRRLWHLLLEGDKGCLIWWSEDCIDWKSEDYALTPRGKALAPVLNEMTSPLAGLFMRAEREYDPVAIHYSQPSVQVDWLLESTGDGSTWLRRFSSFESEHNKQLHYRQGWVATLENAGYTPRFISTQEIENGALKDYRVLVMPESFAISEGEAAAIKQFIAPGAQPAAFLFGDGFAGQFDAHGRLRARGAVHEILGERWQTRPPSEVTLVATSHPQPGPDFSGSFAFDLARLDRPTPDAWLAGCLRTLPPAVDYPRGIATKVRRYRLGSAQFIAFERNIHYRMGEDLKQAADNRALETPVAFTAYLRAKAHIYDLRSGRYLGFTDNVHVDLDPWVPSLFALLAEKLPDGTDVVTALAPTSAKP